jgi:hypothetical protein
MTETEKILAGQSCPETKFAQSIKIGKQALIVAVSAAMAIVVQTPAWATTCKDGSTMPALGYNAFQMPSWTPGVYTGTLGSLFIPDTSTSEGQGGPNTGPDNTGKLDGMGNPLPGYYGHGHNWVMDQGSTLCKQIDNGSSGLTSNGWTIPVTSITSSCIFLPIVKGGRFTNFGGVPGQSDAITLPCDTSKLAGGPNNAQNNYKNQLGCAVVASQSADGLPHNASPEEAPSYIFAANVQGGLFNIPLMNDPAGAGKIAVNENYYSDIPEGQKLTNVAVSKSGEYVIATSIRRAQYVYACHNPLGDPGDIHQPINMNSFLGTQSSNLVKCMQVGNNGLQVDLVTGFGPDDQPYFGGQRFMNSFNGGNAGNKFSAASWPQCITQGTPFSVNQAFAAHSGGHCGNAQPNGAFTNSLIIQPSSFATHGDYVYTAANAGALIQFHVTKNPVTGASQYSSKTYVSSIPGITTGIGVADDLQSLMVYSDPSGIGAAGAEVVTKVPLCEP